MSFLLNREIRKVWGTDDEAGLLAAYEQVWARKTILRRIYEAWYAEIGAALQPGFVIEIGAGTGNFKRWLQAQGRTCGTVDILPGRFVDLQADALRLPFQSKTVDNIVLIDALHHFARPVAFLEEAARVLRPAGRLVMLEPYVSVWGYLVWKYLHHETVDFDFQESDDWKAAWAGNAAIPRLILAGPLPLRISSVAYRDWLAYPACGGFSYRSLLPQVVLLGLQRLERCRLFRNRFLSLRVLAVLEKHP